MGSAAVLAAGAAKASIPLTGAGLPVGGGGGGGISFSTVSQTSATDSWDLTDLGVLTITGLPPGAVLKTNVQGLYLTPEA